MGLKTARKLSLVPIAAIFTLLAACGGGGGAAGDGNVNAVAQPQGMASYTASPTTFSPGMKDPGSSTGNSCPVS